MWHVRSEIVLWCPNQLVHVHSRFNFTLTMCCSFVNAHHMTSLGFVEHSYFNIIQSFIEVQSLRTVRFRVWRLWTSFWRCFFWPLILASPLDAACITKQRYFCFSRWADSQSFGMNRDISGCIRATSWLEPYLHIRLYDGASTTRIIHNTLLTFSIQIPISPLARSLSLAHATDSSTSFHVDIRLDDRGCKG